ncbi:MAG: 16S rRNA (cytosine(1402)-N(4))-methyltransferase RsmH [Bacteroidetes bacterium]|nr:16S rRNA (cytosine(1402)-N(4))-methyltransferase RsmH [Bacteroidota bacterium]
MKATDQPGGNETGYHVPVLLHEVTEGLQVKANGIYVDCTFGGGGHSRAILEKLGPGAKLIVFDQDINANQNLPDDERVIFIQQNFRHLQRFLRVNKCAEVDGILADLGVSSHQFNEAERGFSIRYDAALDMRMDVRQELTAADILKNFSELQLHKMFEKNGEVTNAKTLARTIVEQRMIAPLKTISQFKEAVKLVVKGNPNKYFAQVFQALRIEVNDEIGALKEMLEQSVQVLKTGGRIAIISFHSLEDRLVKNFFKEGTFEEKEEDVFGRKTSSPFKIVTKKPITPGEAELKLNPRSRSSKLRIAEKI